MTLYQRFLRKPEFGSYEDFLHNFRINVPENFNFAYDVLDVIAEEEPDKRALQWAHMDGRERAFTFAEIARLSKQAANLFVRLGIQKGDKVMLVLRRHYTFWIAIMALCRIGAVAVPATHLLTKKDIVYRANCAGIKMVVTSAEGCFAASCEEALSECPTVEKLLIVDGEREGWLDFEGLLAQESDEFPRPAEPLKHDDIMLLYFTSGTSGMPKMVGHNFDYPLGHIQTAVFWHQCVDGGLHLTVSETGWMKSVWGKLYGQWLAGSAIMVYDFEKFVPKDMLAVLEKYKVTTFCAPPTIYRFMILEDVSKYDLSSIQHCTTAGEPLNPCLLYTSRLVRLHAVAHTGRPAQADLLLHGEGAGDVAGIVVFQEAHQGHATHAVVQGLGLDQPRAELLPVGAKAHIVARFDQLFGLLLGGGADVDIQIVMLEHFFKFGAGLQMDGLGADDAGHFRVPHQHRLGYHHARVDAAHGFVAQKAVVVDAQHHKAYFVHMRGEQHVFFALRALFVGQQVADGINPHARGVLFNAFADKIAHAPFVAADAAQQAQFL